MKTTFSTRQGIKITHHKKANGVILVQVSNKHLKDAAIFNTSKNIKVQGGHEPSQRIGINEWFKKFTPNNTNNE